jgi:FixJ family two-component response regulator
MAWLISGGTVAAMLVWMPSKPGGSCTDVRRWRDRTDMPIIFITGHGDVPMTVQAMKAGAVEFLTKPFDDEVLLSAIRSAIERSQMALGDEVHMRVFK